MVGRCRYAFLTAQFRDGDLASESFQDDPDLLVCRESLAGGLPDLLDDIGWFLTHNHSSFLGGQCPIVEPESSASSLPRHAGEGLLHLYVFISTTVPLLADGEQ